MKKPEKDRLARAIEQQYGFRRELALQHAERVLAQTPEVLWPNIEEWMEGKELSEIRIGQYTVPMILHIRSSRDFLDALAAITDYSRDPALGENRIWRTVG